MTALQREYSRFNRRYFSNRLPEDMQVRWSRSLPDSLYGCFDEPQWSEGILINANLKKFNEIALLTLLHEMAHVATTTERAAHGPRWRREMRRLARIGAFDNLW